MSAPIQPPLPLPSMVGYQVHEHARLNESREWRQHFKHSHADGERGHLHPATGPGFYGYGKRKFAKRLNGEQHPYVERPAEDAFFDVFICDGALVPTADGKGLRPLTDDDIENGVPGLEDVEGTDVVLRMERRFDLTARFHDLRTRR